jgi:hypothetical protein
MSGVSTNNASDTLNRVAIEVGLLTSPAADPFGATEEYFAQLRYLMQTAGEELILSYPWSAMTRRHSFVTDGSGEYPLPDDYLYMIEQTGWDASWDRPLAGPLTPQEWVYISERMDTPIRAMFRLQDGIMTLLHDQTGKTISFEYMSRNWISPATTPDETTDTLQQGSDIPLYDRTLFSRYLKVKWLDAKGFDSSKAQDDFNQMFNFLTSKDKSAPVLFAGGGGFGPRLLGYANIPDTGYGM